MPHVTPAKRYLVPSGRVTYCGGPRDVADRQMIPDQFRGPEGKAPFGAQTEAPAGACPADELAAFLGRSV